MTRGSHTTVNNVTNDTQSNANTQKLKITSTSTLDLVAFFRFFGFCGDLDVTTHLVFFPFFSPLTSSSLYPSHPLFFSFISGAYLVGFVVASLIFAHLSPKFQPLRFMACALLAWCTACVASGFGAEATSLAFARMFTGVGEAAFIILAPVCVRTNDIRTVYLFIGLFYGRCQKISVAFGFRC